MLRKIVCLLLLVSLLSFNVLAPDEGEAGAGGFANIAELIMKANAQVVANNFESNPEETKTIIEETPVFMERDVVAAAAFKNDDKWAAKVINDNPKLMKAEPVKEQFDLAVQEDPSIANNNDEAARAWFQEQHNIKTDEKIKLGENFQIAEYDGKKIATETLVPVYIDVDDEPSFVQNIPVGHLTLTGGHYDQGDLRIAEDGTFVFTPASEGQKINIPDKDVLIMDTNGRTVDYKGNSVKGKLNMMEDFLFVAEDNSVEINHVEIIPTNIPVSIYFDGEYHERDNYVSLNKDTETLVFGQSKSPFGEEDPWFQVNFKPDNPFIDVAEDADLEISLSPNTDAIVQKVNRRGTVTVVGNSGMRSRAYLVNGEQGYKIDIYPSDAEETGIGSGASVLHFRRPGISFSKYSVPFTLLVKNKEDENVLGPEEEPQKMFFDSRNNYVVFSEDASLEEISQALAEKERKKIVLFEGEQRQIREEIYEMGIEYINDAPGTDLKRLKESLEKLPADVRKSIRELHVLSIDKVHGYCGENTGGCAISGSRRIIIPQSFSDSMVHHEAVHTRTYEEGEMGPAEKKYREKVLELKRKYGVSPGSRYGDLIIPESGSSMIPENEREELKLLERKAANEWQEKTSLKKEWWENFGPVLGKGLGPPVVNGANAVAWSDGTDGPRHGCITPYACNDYYELTAVTAEKAAEPDSHRDWAPLIMPGSPQYDPRFRTALDLAHKSGYLSGRDYDRIINFAETGKLPEKEAAGLEAIASLLVQDIVDG